MTFTDENGLSINYRISGEGKPVLMLHGWGACIDAFAPVINGLSPYRQVIALDFPGFGESDAPAEPVDVTWYMERTLALMDYLGLQKTDIICHSFGGRVTILLAARHPERVGRIVFTDAAGLRKEKTAAQKRSERIYKLCKKAMNSAALRAALKVVGIDAEERMKNAGSADYRALSGPMRGTFVKVVNEDLRPYLPSIKSPSLLIYGENDTDTPVSFGEIMEREIPDAGLVILPNAGHFSYLDQPQRYMAVVKVFLEVG